jgi:ABC-type uncharacterized transport system permease subunit
MLESTTQLAVPAAGVRGWRFGRVTLEVRQHMPLWHRTAILSAAIVLGLAISVTILAEAGVEPSELFQEVIVDNLFVRDNFFAVLRQTWRFVFASGISASRAR